MDGALFWVFSIALLIGFTVGFGIGASVECGRKERSAVAAGVGKYTATDNGIVLFDWVSVNK